MLKSRHLGGSEKWRMLVKGRTQYVGCKIYQTETTNEEAGIQKRD